MDVGKLWCVKCGMNDNNNLLPNFFHLIVCFLLFDIEFLSVMLIRMSSAYVECLLCFIHMWFSEGVFPQERVELHFEFSVLFFRFFCMLKKNTMRWTCGIVKVLAVADLLYVYHEIADRKCNKDSLLPFAYVALVYAANLYQTWVQLFVVGFLKLCSNLYVRSEI